MENRGCLMLNLATGTVLMLSCCFIMYVISVFFTPPLPDWLNPFPPPTLPPRYVLPTPSEADLVPTNPAPLPTQPPVVPTATQPLPTAVPTEAAPTDVPAPSEPAMEEGSMEDGESMEEVATATPIIGSDEGSEDAADVPTIGAPPTEAAPTDDPASDNAETSEATVAPTAADAATEAPTEEAAATATATEVANSQPAATPTFSAFPFTLQDNGIQYTSFPGGCTFMGVAGQVFDLQGTPILGSSVEISGGAVDGAQSITGTKTDYGAGGYEIKIADSTEDTVDVYSIRLYNENGAPLSDEISITTSDNCDNNLILVNFVQNR